MIESGDYVIAATGADGQRVAIPSGAAANGGYCVIAKTADGKDVGVWLDKLDTLNRVGIVAKTADGELIGLTFARPVSAASIWKLDTDGNLIKSYDTAGTCLAVSANGGQVYGANYQPSFYSGGVQCFDENTAALLWYFQSSDSVLGCGTISGLAHDASGNVYACGSFYDTSETGNFGNAIKLSSGGTLLRHARVGDGPTQQVNQATDISVASSVLWLSTFTTYGIMGKTPVVAAQANLSLETSLTIGGDRVNASLGQLGYGAQAFSNGDLYLAHNRVYPWGWATVTGGFPLTKKADTTDTATAVRSDGSSVWLTTTRQNVAKSVYKYPAALGASPSWSYDTGAHAAKVAVDASGNCYVAGARSGGKSVWKINGAGSLVWSYDTGGSTSSVFFDGTNVFVCGDRVIP